MKFFVSIIVTAILAFACGLYLPWWSVAVASLIVAAFIYQPPLRSFLSGFCGILVLWLILILAINSSNQNVLAPKISLLMGFGGAAFTLVILSCLIGAITGGLGALTGSLFRRIF